MLIQASIHSFTTSLGLGKAPYSDRSPSLRHSAGMLLIRHKSLFGIAASLAVGLAACSSPSAAGSSTERSAAGAPSAAGTASGGGATASGGGATASGGGATAGATAPGGGGGSAPLSEGGSSAAGAAVACGAAPTATIDVDWGAINEQPTPFYATAQARALADNILYYQNADHGWPKNVDMTSRAAPKAGSTIDNRATTTQLEYLARVFSASNCSEYRDAVRGGIEFLLEAQYDNGGWPQVYPNPDGYHKHITFNDDAMIHVLQLLRAVASNAAPYAFLDDALQTSASSAVSKGIDCILGCQIRMADGKRGWCAQHDESSLKPAQARTYELPSVSGAEGALVARFLMTIDPPTPEIREAVEGAIAWFQAVKLSGIRVEKTVDAAQPTGEDRVVVQDASAPPLWARFYELGTDRPIFSSRCEVPECEADPFFQRRYTLAEIENERRVGYSWYGDWPAAAISEYAAWKAKYPAP
jgi:PelA/Pel-15E family pectate lyase